ncbi:hypothetical protein [Pedobacter sp. UBA4863]|uniref:hypothetical protein n=1 Tax=Pedobacter sp. UBA4863 TaxID=1947060 RepID=UPI0025F0B62E|nr:hypothetical protein [Pedobacter sp. UBA4863]
MTFVKRHKSPKEMVIEALEEHIFAAKYLLNYRKLDKHVWANANGGVLGFPATILLFAIVDTIGSYYRNTNYQIQVDGLSTTIDDEGWQHFKILNSLYFNLNLSTEDLKQIYVFARSKLVHNSVIGSNFLLKASNDSPFIAITTTENSIKYVLNLKSFCRQCEQAIINFRNNADEIFQNSKIGRKLPGK